MKIISRLLTALFLLTASLCPRSARGESTNAPATPVSLAASPAQVDAFLAKWKPIIEKQGFLGAANLIHETNALANVLGALEREPAGPWVMYLRTMLQSPARDAAKAPAALQAWKQASATLTRALKASPADPQLAEALVLVNQSLAEASLDAGQLDEATAQATALLAQNRKGWNYGNVIYDAHSILGRAALRQGKIAEAKKELLEAGQTPGSPQLNSFGPQFTLARELLEKGEKDTVIQFLDLVAQFWANPDKETYAPYREDKLKRRATIENWKEEIRAGKVPTDHKWR